MRGTLACAHNVTDDALEEEEWAWEDPAPTFGDALALAEACHSTHGWEFDRTVVQGRVKGGDDHRNAHDRIERMHLHERRPPHN